MNASREIRVPALEITQGKDRKLYTFAVDGKLLHSFATISRVKRDEDFEIEGYQRPEVRSHIQEIQNYIESNNPLIPNALVVAFDQRVRFEPSSRSVSKQAPSRPGELVIPIDDSLADDEKPGWIVDGQQRAAAVREAKVDSFPLCINAFIAHNDREQREQFILVNSTKPLPKGLIYELLPSTDALLPTMLQRRRFPAYLLERLNHDEDSPLKGKIKTATVGEGVIKDNSILKMVENSLTDGALYQFRDSASGEGDVESMLLVLKRFWEAVSQTFTQAWQESPRDSRLVHGAGIASMGFLMDAITDRYRNEGLPTVEQYADDLEPLAKYCSWTAGYWDLGQGTVRKWNEIQNTSKDIDMLANFLLTKYKTDVWSRRRVGQQSNFEYEQLTLG